MLHIGNVLRVSLLVAMAGISASLAGFPLGCLSKVRISHNRWSDFRVLGHQETACRNGRAPEETRCPLAKEESKTYTSLENLDFASQLTWLFPPNRGTVGQTPILSKKGD